MNARPGYEIWCRVVDNFGDAGVCWRLARQLASRPGTPVSLRVDRLATLARIEPRARAGALVDGVRILAWDEPRVRAPGARTAVVSAFGCELPADVRADVAAHGDRTLWVNLEYLSAEPWVDGCHALASVKPGDGAVEHFFYPGFTHATGGLLREHGLLARRDAFRAGTGAERWLDSIGIRAVPGALRVSVFCYPDAPLARLCDAIARDSEPVHLLLAHGVGDLVGDAPAPPGAPGPRAQPTVSRVPWLAQDDYDRLLWSCDVNFVRGEDSWVRAHWAGVPFVWQPYRQLEGAHFAKLDAFLDRLAGASEGASDEGDAASEGPAAPTDRPRAAATAGDLPAAAAARSMMRAWSGDGDVAAAWHAYRAALPRLRLLHLAWAAQLAAQPDLAASLVRFCENRL